jgi:hypothetical protein
LVPIWRILGVSADHERLVLTIMILVPESMLEPASSKEGSEDGSRPGRDTRFPGTSQVDIEVSSLFVLRSVQQLIASAMEV